MPRDADRSEVMRPGRGRPLLITAGRVLLGYGHALEDAGVVLEDGRIVRVAPVNELRRGARGEIERFPDGCLVPGFIDAHVHLCFGYGADLTADPGELSDATLAAAVALTSRRLLAAGVTSVRDLGSVGRVVQRARDAIRRRDLEGPRILAAGRPITTADGHLRSFGLLASGEAGMAAAVRTAVSDGIDVVKVVATGGAGTPGTALGRAQFTTGELRAAVLTAAGGGLPVAAHAHGTEGIARAVAAGVHTLEHCSWMDTSGEVGPIDATVLAEMRRRRQVAVIAGPLPQALAERLMPGERPSGDSRPAAASPAAESLLAIWSHASVAREHGVIQALGTDALFGQFGDYHDLAWRAQGLVELAGWPEARVLEALWQGGAAALGAPGVLGMIAPSAYADLVVLGRDPRSDIRALHDVRAVFRGGRRAG